MYFNNFYKWVAYLADSFMVLFILLNKGIDQKSMFISNVNKPFKITELLCRPLVKLTQQLVVTLYTLTNNTDPKTLQTKGLNKVHQPRPGKISLQPHLTPNCPQSVSTDSSGMFPAARTPSLRAEVDAIS